MREKRHDRGQNNSVDLRTLVLTVTVSLFIAMMAFFIMLNSFTVDSAEKLARVKQSIGASFGFLAAGQAIVVSEESEGGYLNRMEKDTATILRSVLPEFNFRSRNLGGGVQILEVDLPSERLSDDWQEIRSRISDVMVNRSGGRSYKLQLVAQNGPEGAQSFVSHAVDLVEDGVSPTAFSIGYENAGRDTVTLRFVLEGK